MPEETTITETETVTETPEENMQITDLPGVGAATADKLLEAGFDNMISIAVASPSEISERADVGEATATKIIAAARKMADIGGFSTAAEIDVKQSQAKRCTTGSEELDKLLGGGYETGSTYEFYAEFGSGKSQSVFTAAVTATLPEAEGGLDGEVVIIDTENTFRADRIKEIAAARGLDPEVVLSKVHVARAFNSAHQMLLMDKVRELCTTRNVKVICIDSIMNLFRAEYVGRGTLAARQGKLNDHLGEFTKIIERFDCIGIYTNQVMSNPGQLFGDPTKPTGGHIMGHAATYRLYLRKSKGNKRVAKLVDSPNLPADECVFAVGAAGVCDE